MAMTIRNRRVLARDFLNPYCDGSDPKFDPQEIEIIDRMKAGEELSQRRFDSKGRHGIGWVWMTYPKYPDQWDGPIVKLISRGVIRSVKCAGGYTWMIFTDRAMKVFGIRSQAVKSAPYSGAGSFRSLEQMRRSAKVSA